MNLKHTLNSIATSLYYRRYEIIEVVTICCWFYKRQTIYVFPRSTISTVKGQPNIHQIRIIAFWSHLRSIIWLAQKQRMGGSLEGFCTLPETIQRFHREFVTSAKRAYITSVTPMTMTNANFTYSTYFTVGRSNSIPYTQRLQYGTGTMFR